MAGTHAQKSPSGAERFHACNGSIALVNALPKEQRSTAGAAAQKGTAAHGLLERCLETRTPPKAFLGRVIELVGENEDVSFLRKGAKLPKAKNRVAFLVDVDMVEGVAYAYDKAMEELAKDPYTKLETESRTNPLPERDDCDGTADITLDSWPEDLHVIDYKNGRMVVEHFNNPQLLAYLLGKAHERGFDYRRFKISVVQPNAYHEEGPVRTFEIDAEGLKAFEASHRAAVERADEALEAYALITSDEDLMLWANKYLVAGDHCTMCNAAGICPKYREKLALEAKADFDAFPITEDYGPPDVTDPARAAAIVKWAPLMKALIKSAETYLYNALMNGREVEGFKVVRGKANRVWREDLTPAQIEAIMVKEGFLSDNEKARLWTEPQLVTGPQAEKLVDKDKRKEFSAKLLHKPDGGLRVVPSSDRGDPVTVNPASEFVPLELDSED